jgi:putative endopeptidase
VTGPQDNGSAFSNYAAVCAASIPAATDRIDKPVDQHQRIFEAMSVYEVNASFFWDSNTLYFPAAFLTAPYYDKNASFETNMGAMGITIGHELIHGLDNNGAQYDENGLSRNWWSDADYANFEQKVDGVIHYFDGYEYAPGVDHNSSQTTGEDLSDIGALSLTLQYLKEKKSNPDYNAFFLSYSHGWADGCNRQAAEAYAVFDTHSPPWVRVNACLSNFQEFYDSYNILPSDGMYVPPDDRIQIW